MKPGMCTFVMLLAAGMAEQGSARVSAANGKVEISVLDQATGKPMPCRVHLKDAAGKAQRAAELPFWRDHFVCPGTMELELAPGWSGEFHVHRPAGDIELLMRAAARLVGLNILSTVRAELGSLDKVVRVVKTLGMVQATPDFTQHPQVINGFSDLMVEVFGEKAGKGARSAVGMSSLPGGIPVEIEVIFQVRD